MKIKYIEGDLFEAIKANKNFVVIPHVCNNKGGFGSGFVVPLSKHFPEARTSYFEMNLLLGDVGFVQVGKVTICNMIAQVLGGERPLFYNSLAECMTKVGDFIGNQQDYGKKIEIHAPAFGTGLAGGDFNVILPLIIDCWVRPFDGKLPINIYYLPGTFLPPTVEIT